MRVLTVTEDHGVIRLILLKAARTSLWRAVHVLNCASSIAPAESSRELLDARNRLVQVLRACSPHAKLPAPAPAPAADHQLPLSDRLEAS